MRKMFAAVAAVGLAVATSARCEIVTRRVDFNLAHSVPGFSDLVGSFTVTFDRSQDYYSETVGLTFSSFSVPGVPSGFIYSVYADSLAVGGLENGVEALTGDTVDYNIVIYGFTGPSPSFFSAASTNGSLDIDLSYTGTLTETDPSTSDVPEPASVAAIGVGLAGLAGLRRRHAA